MTDVIIASVAEKDYAESLCWSAKRSIEPADRFESEFDRAIKKIAADPEKFPHCDARHHFHLMRRYPFQIIYRIVDTKVVIIAVAHTSRRPDYWAKR